MSILQIELDDFLPWFEARLDEKHGTAIEPLKNQFLSFICLVNQIIHLFVEIREKVLSSKDQQTQSNGKLICDNSILTLKSMTANFPSCLDLSYCERFVKEFEEKLSLMMWYHHSLNHLEEQSTSVKFRFQTDKISEGINKLYYLAAGIKESTKEAGTLLKNMSDYKKLFSSRISSIKMKIEEYTQAAEFFEDFEKISMGYGEHLQKNIQVAKEEDELRYEFMVTYFRLLNRCLATQVQLESALQLPIRICQELKAKKKYNSSLASEPSWPSLSKYTNLIVKPHFVSKHVKKIKLQEFMNFIRLVLNNQKEVLPNFDNLTVEPDRAESKIRQLIESALEDMRELQKVDKYSVALAISIYRDRILPVDTKKFVEQLAQYQNWMYKYYKLNDQIKTLQKIVQTSVAKETHQKVELVVVTN